MVQIQTPELETPHPILEAVSRLDFDFVFAKTMPEMPHEYTVRRKARDDADYVALYEAIMNDGIVEYWGKNGKRFYPVRYLYPGDGHRYWSMSGWRSDTEGRHPLHISRHINRSSVEAAELLRLAGQLRSEPPPALRLVVATPGEVRYTAAFARTFRALLAPHGFQQVEAPDPLVVFTNHCGVVVEIVNPSLPGGSKIASYTIIRAGQDPQTGRGRDQLADMLGVPRFRR